MEYVNFILLLIITIVLVRPVVLEKLGFGRKYVDNAWIGIGSVLVVSAVMARVIFGFNMSSLIWIVCINIPYDIWALWVRRQRVNRSKQK